MSKDAKTKKKPIGFGGSAGVKGIQAVTDARKDSSFVTVSISRIRYDFNNKRPAENYLAENFDTIFPDLFKPDEIQSDEFAKSVLKSSLPDTELPQESVSMALEKIMSLAVSIHQNGLLQPIGIKDDGKGWVITYGHRRYIAFKLLGIDRISAKKIDSKTSELDVLLKRKDENQENEDIPLIGRIYEYVELRDALFKHLRVDTLPNTKIAQHLNYNHRDIGYYTKAYELLSHENTRKPVAQYLDNNNFFGLRKLLSAIGNEELHKVDIKSVIKSLGSASQPAPSPAVKSNKKKKAGRATSRVRLDIKNLEVAKAILRTLKEFDEDGTIEISDTEVETFDDLKFIESLVKKL